MKHKAVILIAAMLPGCTTQAAGGPRFVTGGAVAGDYAVPVQSVLDRRFAGVVRQKYDFSCGSAALATLLRHHYDYAVAEENAFHGMWAKGDRAQIRRVGFSLLDMKRWLSSRGLDADGYRVPLDRVAETGIPGIALISLKNYRHFVVVKGVNAHEVLLGDPSAGLTVMPRAKFQSAWNGIYFVIGKDQALAKSRFNQPGQWLAYARAPIGASFSHPVSQQALQLTTPGYGDI